MLSGVSAGAIVASPLRPMRGMRTILASLILVLAGCGGDDGGSGVDAPQTTGCGTGPPCDYATQICVVSTPIGPGEAYECMPLPGGCVSNRTCGCVGSALCTSPFDTCSDRDPPNTVACECLECQ